MNFIIFASVLLIIVGVALFMTGLVSGVGLFLCGWGAGIGAGSLATIFAFKKEITKKEG